MAANGPPIQSTQTYTKSIRGAFGTFGKGAGIQVCFIQGTLRPRDLKDISLVSEIPGSDKWPVQQLFQREVDELRSRDGDESPSGFMRTVA